MNRTVWAVVGGVVLLVILTAGAGWGVLAFYQTRHPGAQLFDPAVKHLWFQVVGLLLVVGVGVVATLLEMRQRTPRAAAQYGSHGTARWASTGELLQRFNTTGQGLIVGQLPGLGRKDPPRYLIHPVRPRGLNPFVLVIGGSGAYKSAAYVIPNLLHELEASIVVPDPKGDCFRETAVVKRAQGYRILKLDLINLLLSLRWNPMDCVKKPADAVRLSATIIANTQNPNQSGSVGESFWSLAEEGLLTALILYVKLHRPPEEHHLGNVLTLGTELKEDELNALFDALPQDDPARRQFRTFRQAEEKVRSGVLVGFGNRLQLWNDDEMIALTAASDFDVRDLGRTRTILYVTIPPGEPTYAPFLALFWTLMTQELTRLADEEGGQLPVPVRMRLEEAANIGAIPNLPERVSTTRGQGIWWEFIFQTLGQFKARYPAGWSEIAGNCDTWIYLGGNDLETLKYVSDRLGSTTIQIQSSSSSRNLRGESEGESVQYTARPLMMPDELGRLPESQQLLLQRGQYPARVEKPFYKQHPAYRQEPTPIPEIRPDRGPPALVEITTLAPKPPKTTKATKRTKPKEEDD